jgi:hypothetical protein
MLLKNTTQIRIQFRKNIFISAGNYELKAIKKFKRGTFKN